VTVNDTSENRRLPQAASYFPLQKGSYDVGPELNVFGLDFGNGVVDQQVFQIDENFTACRQVKLDARNERLSKYYRTQMLSSDVLTTILRFIIERLTLEYPELFQLVSQTDNDMALYCKLTNETLIFDQKLRFLRVQRNDPAPSPDYHDSLDALACQIQEDLAIISRSPFGRDWLAAVHLCQANNWAAEEKIGQPFQSIHEPVAGMKNSERDAKAIVNTIVNKGPFVRFAWGLTPEAELNQHPRPCLSSGTNTETINRFNPHKPSLYLRVERQTLWPFPDQQAALFTIRTYLTDCKQIRENTEQNEKLVSALQSMTKEQLKYKCLNKDYKAIVKWLSSKHDCTKPNILLSKAIHHLYRMK
jgi:hypothetical protein